MMVWDPLALAEVRCVFGDAIGYAGSVEECLRQSKTVVIVNPLRELAAADWSQAGEAAVIDCWRCLSTEAAAQAGCYVPLGSGPQGDVAEWVRETVGSYFDLLTN